MNHLIEQAPEMGWLWTGVFECVSEWVDILKLFFYLYSQYMVTAISPYPNSFEQAVAYIMFCAFWAWLRNISTCGINLCRGLCSSWIWCYVSG